MLPTNGRITQDFYTPVDYIAGRTHHEALDIVTNGNQPIYALGEGVVTKVIDGKGYLPNSGYGNEVWIQYDNGVLSRACHCAIGIVVKVGQRVVNGQRVAYTGATGYRFPLETIHCHYETMIDGVRVDPLKVEYPQQNNQDQPIKKRMKITDTYRLVFVRDNPEDNTEYWIIKQNTEGPKETRHKVMENKMNVRDFFSSIGAYSEMKRSDLKGLTAGNDFDWEAFNNKPTQFLMV